MRGPRPAGRRPPPGSPTAAARRAAGNPADGPQRCDVEAPCVTLYRVTRIDHTVRGSWTPSGGAAAHLPPHALRWLRARTGLDMGAPPVPIGPDSAFRVPDPALPEAARAAFAALLGAGHV